MCGIAGVASASVGDLAPAVRRMCAEMIHRGPDSGGEHVTPHVALGIRRLRVVDLVTGDQPIANEDRSVWTAFNGEIYNFRELREELAARGHRFETSGDTETIVHLYEEHGERFVSRLEGMFAIALWDEKRRTLLLARDRLGKKPLLYRQEGDRLVFASEYGALLSGSRGMAPDPLAIRAYLRLGYVPAPRSAFTGASKLPPAHVLVWRDGRIVSLERYWSLPEAGSLRIGEEEAVTELRRLLERAVRRRLVADVPIGAFLSGGVDSSGVVATMAGLVDRVRTFSIGFEDADFDELAHARRVAERYGTEHHEFVVRPDAAAVLPALVRHYGEPYADSSAVPTFHLARLTRQHVTVALNGDGGDEVFGGYERYAAARAAGRLDALPSAIRRPLFAAAARLLPDSVSPLSRTRRARRFLKAASLPPRARYLRWVGVFDAGELGDLMSPEFAALTAGAELELPFVGPWSGDAVASAQALDFGWTLPDDLLAKVDIASMAVSLEVRSPLLDREIVEFGFALPTELKIRGFDRKHVLKRALADRVPAENMYRRKQGFGVPVGSWMRNDLRELVEDTVLSDTAQRRGYFRRDRLERLVGEHTSGAVDHTHRLWALLMLELWHREVADGPMVLAA